MRWTGHAYRAHDPRWAWTPLSGDGAAIHGGRFNPRGVPALYLALTIEGMFLESSHGFPRLFEPLTVCTYTVDVAGIVDLRSDDDRLLARVELDDLACAWEYDARRGRRPRSWVLSERLRAGGAAGVLVPSFARGARSDMHNLVLWTWGEDLPHRVGVHDPTGRLPRDQLSWL